MAARHYLPSLQNVIFNDSRNGLNYLQSALPPTRERFDEQIYHIHPKFISSIEMCFVCLLLIHVKHFTMSSGN